MLNFTCTKCNKRLYEDTLRTSIYYDMEMGAVLSPTNEKLVEECPQYIIYSCHNCDFHTKMDILQLLKFKQSFILEQVIRSRIVRSIQEAKLQTIKEESGLDYCGVCPGLFDEDGYCSIDWMTLCPTRRDAVDNKI
jgi:ribosomal protein L44E